MEGLYHRLRVMYELLTLITKTTYKHTFFIFECSFLISVPINQPLF